MSRYSRREASPTATIIDRQSDQVDPPGYDAGKKIKGRKCHILVETQGLPMQAIVHAADIQDRDAAGC
jgi:putative transposase